MKRILLSVTTLVLTLFLTTTMANAQTPQDIAKAARTSTVSLTMDNGNSGSGFFVAPFRIATSYDIIKGASSGHIRPILQKEEYPIVGISEIDKSNNMVILKITGTQGIPLPVGDSETVEERDSIYIVGNSGEGKESVTSGVVSVIGNFGSTTIEKNKFVINTEHFPRDSGGAVLNDRGEVIGVIHERGETDADPTDSPFPPVDPPLPFKNFTLVSASEYLKPLLTRKPHQDRSALVKPLNLGGIAVRHLTWGADFYEFTVHNQRNYTIRDLDFLIIFKDQKGEIICTDRIQSRGIMPNGSASRRYRTFVSKWIDKLDSEGSFDLWEFGLFGSTVGPSTKQLMKSYEIRILDFYLDPPYTTQYIPVEGVISGELVWFEEESDSQSVSFSYSLKNNLNKNLENVWSYVVFYDKEGKPIENSMSIGGKIHAMETVTQFRSIRRSVKQLMKSYEIKIPQRLY